MSKTLTYCETISAYKWHIRILGKKEKPNYSGYSGEQPTTLCGLKSSWDLKPPVAEPSLSHSGTCKRCKAQMENPKVTTTAGTLKKGDKIGKRTVRYSTAREYNMGYHVYFTDSETPDPYGKNEPITVELANDNSDQD